MTRSAATTEWSAAITATSAIRAQAENSRIAISLGSATPGDSYIILRPGDSIDIPAGDFRIRSVEARGGFLRWQDWAT